MCTAPIPHYRSVPVDNKEHLLPLRTHPFPKRFFVRFLPQRKREPPRQMALSLCTNRLQCLRAADSEIPFSQKGSLLLSSSKKEAPRSPASAGSTAGRRERAGCRKRADKRPAGIQKEQDRFPVLLFRIYLLHCRIFIKNRRRKKRTQVKACKDAVQALGRLVSLNYMHYCTSICDLSNR